MERFLLNLRILVKKVKVVTTRGGKTTRDPPNPNQSTGKAKEHQEAKPSTKEKEEETTPKDFVNTSYLLFPTRNRKQAVDEQFARFVEMIKNIHVRIPLMDVLHVPSYAKYIKDIINNKRPIPSMEVIKLTEECSTAILNFPKKKKDPWCPTISCSIGIQYFDQALCNLGDSISVMPEAVFDKLNLTQLTPTPMMLQQADSTVRYLAGIAKDILVKI
ncbi:uncharacterized protein [Miscanthus floridulus]|uniref:uncharacterized protein n=1 Tax=Miscanthus floridulus TaxID=154761 RepID=UPI00345B0FCE